MNFQAKIIGTGSYVPEKILSNLDLEQIVDTTNEWIVTRTGMKERRIAASDEFASNMGAKAAKNALENASITPEQIDCIIVATCTPDYQALSTACLIQHEIGAKNASALDIQATCSGYLYGLFIAKSFIESGVYQNILVIAAEKLSSITNYKDRSTCILFGDGASACIVSAQKRAGLFFKSFVLGANGQHSGFGLVPAGGCRKPASTQTIEEDQHYIQMNGQEIFKLAVRQMESACNECLKKANLTEKDINWLVPHQANLRIIEAMAKRFGLSLEQVYITIHKYGNTSASSVGIALDELLKTKPLSVHNRLLLTSVGFGLTWAATILEYQE